MTVVLGSPGSGAGQTDLQQAYDNSPTPGAQITLDNVPNPVGFRAAVAGQIFVIQDVGGATDVFEFTDVQMTVRAPILFDVDLPAYQPANPTAFLWNTNVTYTAAYIGGFIGSQGNVNVQTNTFIWGLLTESRAYIQDVAPSFAAYTLLNGLPVFQNGTGSNQLLAALYMNVGSAHRRLVAGTSNTGGVNAINMAPSLQTTGAAGATMTQVSEGIASMLPQYNTVAGTTVNFGDIFGLRFNQPSIQLFGSGAGVETVNSYVCIDAFPADYTFGGANAVVNVIESNLGAGTNKRLILNVGDAESDFGGGDIHLNDGTLVKLGATVATYDVGMQWNAASSSLLFNWTANGTQLRISEPAANRILFTQETDTQEFNFSCGKFSLGDSTGAVGNQVGNFVTPARTITVAGEWADFLLTQGGNLTVNGNAMSRVSAWVINGVSYANSTGSVTNADTLTVGGFPTSSPGVTITNRHSLNVIGGRSRHASVMQFPPISPTALGSGDTDDWNGLLSGSVNNNMRHWARVSGNADNTSTITGIDSSETQTGDTYKLTNVDAGSITFNHEDTGSLAANRIITPNGQNYTLTENKTIEIVYDTADSRWRILTPAPQASGALSGEWQYDDTTTQADPGDGNFRTDNNTVGSVTEVYIADETKPGTDAGGILSALASGDQLYIFNKEDSSEFLVFDITANNDQTGWHEIQGTVNASGNNFTDGKEFIVTAIFA